MNDKRQRKRIDYNIEVLLDAGKETLVYNKTRDISMNGIFIITDSPFAKGSTGTLTINLTFGEQKAVIKAGFIVARSIKDQGSDSGMGLNFTNLDTESSIHLYNIIAYNSGE
ncbi:MAG: hypothetical protein A2096_04395 [Spirochaetes bacterium GWF1_41_5]|nr:MAG: hypothetical protein A2096_04395 [Spirochaetes bacterium GWF1_41_5]